LRLGPITSSKTQKKKKKTKRAIFEITNEEIHRASDD